MKKYNEGDRVAVTFTGTVLNRRSYDDSGDLRIERDHSRTVTYIKQDELSHVTIEVVAPAFSPKAGEIYLLRAKGSLSDWTTWFCIQRTYGGPLEMVSQAGVFSMELFKDAYLNKGYEVHKGRVSKV